MVGGLLAGGGLDSDYIVVDCAAVRREVCIGMHTQCGADYVGGDAISYSSNSCIEIYADSRYLTLAHSRS